GVAVGGWQLGGGGTARCRVSHDLILIAVGSRHLTGRPFLRKRAWNTALMHRRHLLALAPAAAVSACTASPEDPDPAPDASEGGGAVDDGRQQSSSPSSKVPSAAELLLEELTPRELAGQLVLVGIGAGEAIDPELLSEHHAGGFFLLSVWDSAQAVEETVASAQEG